MPPLDTLRAALAWAHASGQAMESAESANDPKVATLYRATARQCEARAWRELAKLPGDVGEDAARESRRIDAELARDAMG